MARKKTVKQKVNTYSNPVICTICSEKQKNQGALNLHRYNVHGISKKQQQQEQQQISSDDEKDSKAGKTFSIIQEKSFKVDAEILALAQFLIRSGKANNLTDLIKQGIYLQAYGGDKMSNEQKPAVKVSDPLDDLEKFEKESLKREIMEVKLQERKQNLNGNPKKSSGSTSDIIRDLEEQVKLKQLTKVLNGDSDFKIKDLIALQMFDKNMNKQDSSNTHILQQQINDLQKQLHEREMEHKRDLEMRDLRLKIEQMGEKKGMGPDDLMKIWADRDKQIKQMDVQLQQERDKNLREELSMKMQDLQRQLESVPKDADPLKISELKQNITSIKELGKELNGDHKPASMEYLASLGKSVGPAIDKLAGVYAERLKRQNDQSFVQQPMNNSGNVENVQSVQDMSGEQAASAESSQQVFTQPTTPINSVRKRKSVIPTKSPNISFKNNDITG